MNIKNGIAHSFIDQELSNIGIQNIMYNPYEFNILFICVYCKTYMPTEAKLTHREEGFLVGSMTALLRDSEQVTDVCFMKSLAYSSGEINTLCSMRKVFTYFS